MLPQLKELLFILIQMIVEGNELANKALACAIGLLEFEAIDVKYMVDSFITVWLEMKELSKCYNVNVNDIIDYQIRDVWSIFWNSLIEIDRIKKDMQSDVYICNFLDACNGKELIESRRGL